MATAGQFETRYLNRMTSMLESAFEQACVDEDISSAEELLGVLETVLYRAASREEHREKSMCVLQAAFGRMWSTRQKIQAPPRPAKVEPQVSQAVESYDIRHIVMNEACQAF